MQDVSCRAVRAGPPRWGSGWSSLVTRALLGALLGVLLEHSPGGGCGQDRQPDQDLLDQPENSLPGRPCRAAASCSCAPRESALTPGRQLTPGR